MFDSRKTIDAIVQWLSDYLDISGCQGFVVGVSGGVDSGVVSTLCCMTAYPTVCIGMPINQRTEQQENCLKQLDFISGFHDSEIALVPLSGVFNAFQTLLNDMGVMSPHVGANLRSRLRMCTLYAYANKRNHLVAGTGNKIEDFGVGFCTKGGDACVDISPIGNLVKTQVFQIAETLNIPVKNAIPTDGLWDDGRTDEQQLGLKYSELEPAMEFCEKFGINTMNDLMNSSAISMSGLPLSMLDSYIKRHSANIHKMQMPPIGPKPVYTEE